MSPKTVTVHALEVAIITLLTAAPARGFFTSKFSPIWDGWVTWPQVAFRLEKKFTDYPFKLADEESCDREAWNYVEQTLSGLALKRELERKLVYPHRHNANRRLEEKSYWAYKLPGVQGYCYWEPAKPCTVDITNLDSRQLRAIRAELLDHGCEVMPPYMEALIGKYSLNKSGLRAMR